ncbi:ATP-dependent nuclease [Tenacibaculum maritimum]|uniref:ATP-dependent nuclease n=2 Tax=Tenacibaculum maritimum TaxID=107401 RepID=UPI0012E67D7C|nr:AAA family ATPase [Tenacibaculum maritimum]CAA0224663.1 Predicted ATP-dependent endonuclease of the OLD family, contains P-loop ATPase and TOPRIM domains [Tenacibaculum maritimum]
MRLEKLHIQSRFKNLENITIDFTNKEGLSVLIGNNGTGKSNIIEAISSVFAGLYDNVKNPIFSYLIKYSVRNNDVEITFDHNSKIYTCKVNNSINNINNQYLPKQVISCYSGEESRLWNDYFDHFYKNYINAIKGATIPSQPLVFINKYYWDIALLTFHFYDFDAFTDLRDFCQKDLGIETVNFITFEFDTQKINSWQTNPVVNFVKAINPKNDSSLKLSLTELKTRLSYISSNQEDFFNYLTAAFMPKDDKLITNIKFNFNNNLTTSCLSEGEKKLVLVKLILEVIGDESSLILLDEPDSHIHISRKENLQKLLNDYNNRENVLTTHSPTLTHCFDNKHIIMLAKNENKDTEIIEKEKQEIVYQLTNGMWSYQEQNIFLNSQNDILLIEGKTDETFLRKALSVLKQSTAEYSNLEFEYLPCGGADGVKLLADKFTPRAGQNIIALFDRDGAGWKAINGIFNETNKWKSSNFGDYKKCGDLTIMPYPKRNYFKGSNFNVEDYFPKKILNKYALKNFKGLDSLVSKKDFKKSIETDCENFHNSDFKHFKKLFDLILKVKNNQ